MSIRYKVVQNHLKEHLLNSMTVQLDEIGSFRVGFKSEPCDKEEDWDAAWAPTPRRCWRVSPPSR